MKDKDLDKATIDTYQKWVNYHIRQDLNSLSLGPGRLPFLSAVFLLVCAFCFLLVGSLIVALRMQHVYLWDWGAQFLGPFFFILFLLCISGATYMIILAKRRSNKYRSQLYFKPVGDWGVSCVHISDLAFERRHKEKGVSGTTPNKPVKPNAADYSKYNKSLRHMKLQQVKQDTQHGSDAHGYVKNPHDKTSVRHNSKRIHVHTQSERRAPIPSRQNDSSIYVISEPSTQRRQHAHSERRAPMPGRQNDSSINVVSELSPQRKQHAHSARHVQFPESRRLPQSTRQDNQSPEHDEEEPPTRVKPPRKQRRPSQDGHKIRGQQSADVNFTRDQPEHRLQGVSISEQEESMPSANVQERRPSLNEFTDDSYL